jgi:hypothetical protein
MTILHSLLSNPSDKKNEDSSLLATSGSHWVEVEDTRLGTTYKPSHVCIFNF